MGFFQDLFPGGDQELVVAYVKKTLQEALSSDAQTAAICKHVACSSSYGFFQWDLGSNKSFGDFNHDFSPAFPTSRLVYLILGDEACIHLVISMAGSTAGQRILSPGPMGVKPARKMGGPHSWLDGDYFHGKIPTKNG